MQDTNYAVLGDRHRRRFYLFLLLALVLGAVAGSGCALVFQKTHRLGGAFAENYLAAFLHRPMLQTLLACTLFPVLLFLCSQLSFSLVSVTLLFGLHGFLSGYTVCLLTAAAGSRGTVLAAVTMLPFLLPLPLFLLSACAFVNAGRRQFGFRRMPAFGLLAGGCVLLCCLLGFYLAPYFLRRLCQGWFIS